MFKRLLLVSVGVILGLCAAEISLRLIGRPRPPIIGWRGHYDPNEVNELGFRGRKFKDAGSDRLLLLGDSQVESAASQLEQMPETCLELALKRRGLKEIRVVSIGCGGWGQDQELAALASVVKELKPKTVLLWFTPQNDIWNNVFPTHFPRNGYPKPTYWLEAGRLVGPNVAWLAPYEPSSTLYLHRALRRALGVPLYPLDEEWEKHLPAPYVAEDAPSGMPTLLGELARINEMSIASLPSQDDENFATEKTHHSLYLVPTSPRLQYGIDLTHALLRKIEAVCAENGANFCVMYADVGASDDNRRFSDSTKYFEYRGKAYGFSGNARQARLEEVTAGLSTVHVSFSMPGTRVSKTDAHLSTAANQLLMDRVAEELLRRRLGPFSLVVRQR
ncbi:MAG: hypothetical protein U0894_20780 [Pirellulales bacterium]